MPRKFDCLIMRCSSVKCLWSEILHCLIRKSFQNDEERRSFYSDSTLGCRVIQDFDLCKLDDIWRHFVDTKWYKNWVSLTNFSARTELKLSTVVTLITNFHDMSTVTFPWQHYGLQALCIQRRKSEFSSTKKCYLILLFIQWVWVNKDITQHKQKKVC